MNALNFLKFWRPTTMNSSTFNSIPHLVVETDSDSDEEDSFFDLELTVHDFDNNKTHRDPQKETKFNISKPATDEVDFPQKTTTHSVSPNEQISKRKVLPIEPISKPQSPIALLRSAPSFRIFMFRKQNKMPPQETSSTTECDRATNQKKETKVCAVKLNDEDFQFSPALSRDNSTRSFGIKVRSHGSEEPKTERFSKEALQKYLKKIKPLYVKVSKRYSDKMRFSGEGTTAMASPSSSPSVASVSSRKEKQRGFPAGMRVVSKHLGKSRSASTITGIGSPGNRSDDTLMQQHDGIQSAILHCKRSFNSRDSSLAFSTEGSTHSVRNSFEEEENEEV